MAATPLLLDVLPGTFAACRLEPGVTLPPWVRHARVPLFLAQTADETSIICNERCVPDGVRVERGFRALRVRGPLDFGLVGVLASIAAPLAASAISVLAVGTYETDYVLVKATDVASAVDTLRAAGHTVNWPDDGPDDGSVT